MVISFTKETKNEWYSNQVSEVLRIIVRALAMKFNGVYLTCMVRSKTKNVLVGGLWNSKHVPENNNSGLCEAVDFVMQNQNISPEDIIPYIQTHFKYVDIIYYKEKTYYHLETDPPGNLNVEIA